MTSIVILFINDLISFKSYSDVFQHIGIEKGKEQRRSSEQTWKREQRILRACQNAATAKCHNITVGQGFHHSTDHLVFEAKGLFTNWRSSMDEGQPFPQTSSYEK
jgi:hypothetical protein